jgi:hypothetical protein
MNRSLPAQVCDAPADEGKVREMLWGIVALVAMNVYTATALGSLTLH